MGEMSGEVDSGQADVQLHGPESQPQSDVQAPAGGEAVRTAPGSASLSEDSPGRNARAWPTKALSAEFL